MNERNINVPFLLMAGIFLVDIIFIVFVGRVSEGMAFMLVFASILSFIGLLVMAFTYLHWLEAYGEMKALVEVNRKFHERAIESADEVHTDTDDEDEPMSESKLYKKIVWYNDSLATAQSYRENWFTRGFAPKPPEELKYIEIKEEGEGKSGE